MSRLRVHILYEHGQHQRPYGSAYIRLLRPLAHPSLQHRLAVTSGLTYDSQPVDAVIVDRLWRPDISPLLAERLLTAVRANGVKLIYALDDNFLDLSLEKADWDANRQKVVEMFLTEADGILVTTSALKGKFRKFNANIAVVPHALDEQLLKPYHSAKVDLQPDLSGNLAEALNSTAQYIRNKLRFTRKERIVIGYMGTPTHDDDLMMVLPALQAISKHHRDQIEVQIVGVIGRGLTHQTLKGLPMRSISLTSKQSEYPQFMAWFSSQVRWDIAIAPLRDTPFNRCKSDIKFLDYSAVGAAGIYSRVPAYEEAVRHQETGWLTENSINGWIEALEILVTDEQLRKRIGANGNRYLHGERILARCAAWWAEAIGTLLKKT